MFNTEWSTTKLLYSIPSAPYTTFAFLRLLVGTDTLLLPSSADHFNSSNKKSRSSEGTTQCDMYNVSVTS
ncbi:MULTISPECIES: hypothetical protein [unclassified Paenibacillus]|uniref:hypothetical protein n=1 Tax=unclassified Paenibacillus TaxID=185978 RepID=UPI0015E3FD38|nr:MULTISPECIES: hypothetical protein [unclassified Paenibacillus]